MHFEKLVEGERVESIILSPRSAQGYALASNRSPRSDQFIPNPSPTSSPRIEQTVIPPSPSPRRQLEDVVEQAVLNASEQSRDRSIQEKSNMDNEWKGPLYMQVSQIKSKNLKSIKWNGNNDPYVVISIGSWSDETDVVWSASEAFTWPHMNIVGACQTKEDATILFTLYNANLIRDDQVIGVGSVPLESFPRDTSEEVEVDIMEQGGKQRFRGTIMVQLTVTRDAMSTTSHCNSHHAGKDAKLAKVDSILANSNSNSEETPLNPPHSQTENELNRTSTSPKNQKAQPKYSRTNSTERMSKGERRGSTKAEPTGDVPESRNQRARSRRADVQEEDTRASRRTAHLPAPSAEEKLPRSRRQHASSQSLHEEKYQSESNQKTETETELALEEVVPKKSKSTSKKKKESSKKQKKKDLSHSEFIGNRVSVSPDVKRIIDKAYQLALHEECSAIRLNTYEMALVLDALNIELSAAPAEFIPTSTAAVVDDVPDDISFRSSRSGASVGHKDSVLLSLQSPPLLAAALSEFVREKKFIKRNMKSSRPFTLSEQQAIVASNHLISLVQGNWKGTRKLMLMAATNKGVSSEDNRPAYWGPHWLSKMTSILQMPSLHLPENSGEDLINLTEKKIHAFVKPSILRTRCRLYVKLMKYLDQWWKEGSRPQDPLSNENPECDEDLLPVLPAKKKSSSRDILDGDYVKIAKSESLLKAMMPVHRAYAWSANVEELTYFCDLVGGTLGMTLKHPPYGSKQIEAQGMKWVTFKEDATLAHSNISILASLREFDDSSVEFISGRCVYVPQSCLKKHTAPIPDVSTPFTTKTKNLPISNLINCDEVKVGMKVKVLDIDALYRAYERFDWWERPSVAALSSMAGRNGVIVSLPVPSGTDYKRYGVSVVTKQGQEIVDALPPDAMDDTSVVIPPPKKLAVKAASAPSTKVVNNNITHQLNKKKTVEVKLPDHRKATDTSIRNDSEFIKPIPSVVIPFVHYADPPNTGNNNNNTLSFVEEEDREEEMFDMDAPNGGDESLPFPDSEPMTYAEIEEHIRLDTRVKEKGVEDLAADLRGPRDRPLYRPITPSHIDQHAHKGTNGKVNKFTSSIPRSEVTETYSDTHNYGWMQKKVETVDDFDQRVPVPVPLEEEELDVQHSVTMALPSPLTHRPQTQRPHSANAARRKPNDVNPHHARTGRNVKMKTAELDLKSVSTYSEEKNIPRFQANINKSRARAEKEAIKKQRLDYQEDVEENIMFFEGSGSDEGIDFGISGLGFTGAKASLLASDMHDSPKRYPKRPSSANKAVRGAFAAKKSTPPRNKTSVSNNKNYNNDSNSAEKDKGKGKGMGTDKGDLFTVRSSKHHVPSPADDVVYRTATEKSFLKRELRRTEKEAKAKEDSLVSQLKSLGITVQDLDISYE